MADIHLQRPASPMSALAWGALAIGGIFAIIIGLVAIIWPSVTFTVLVVLLGVYAFVSGLFTVLVGAVWPPGWGLRWPMVLQGVLGIVVGVLVFLGPETAARVLIYVVAAWAIISGLLQIATAVRLRRVIPDEWTLIVGGAASAVFGVLLAIWPKEGLIALVWIFGVFAVVFGVAQLVLANRIRRMPID
ncbi:MAG TPA: DUF308 domain-containing protein [Rubrobacter sp.]|nr:DUF308 domain-containing protein [Rubrobacter sp.]